MSTAQVEDKSHALSQDDLRQIIEWQSVLGSADFDLETFMKQIVDGVRNFTHATGAVIELVDGDEMVYRAASGNTEPYIGLRLKVDSSISGYCVLNNDIAICDDTTVDPRVDAAACKKINALSMVVVPLARQKKTVGVLKVISDRKYAFNEYDVYTLRLLSGVLGGALGQQIEINESRTQNEQLRYRAEYDVLTGLPNRALFNDRLTQAIARSKRSHKLIALMYMDIDHFKTINDTYGHGAGDKLLKEFSARITKVIRASDTFARLGGDEFVLIAEGIDTKDQAEQVARKIIQTLQDEISLESHSIKVTSSIGIAISDGQDISPDLFIKQADDALYKAKKAGRNTFSFA